MPLQNRVDPTGEIVTSPARGMQLGNRGCIHRPDRTLGVTRWRTKMWISCVLDWNGRKRDVMPPGRWTALFFLDEVTAMSAGHRPCGLCRRPDHLDFGEAWRASQGLKQRLHAGDMDTVLHRERVESRSRRKVTRLVETRSLPEGAMVRHEGTAALLARGALLPWSFEGYGAALPGPLPETVELLTPPVMVAAMTAGYRPYVHPSAGETGLRSYPGV